MKAEENSALKLGDEVSSECIVLRNHHHNKWWVLHGIEEGAIMG